MGSDGQLGLQGIRRLRFQRGSDRRTREGGADKGQRLLERRTLGVKWIPLFRDAEEADINAALAECEILLVPPGTAILRPGDTNHNVYIPLSGRIVAVLNEAQGEEGAIAIENGECIGELSAIDGKPVSAFVIALADSRVLSLPKEVFWERLMGLSGIARNLMMTLSARMRKTNELALAAQREQLELLHLKKELDVARHLQVSMLPLQRPMFPERTDIEVCGLMEPTSAIGGDLFDAFFVEENRLFLCIGDVSGHGIAAALFMARTIGLLRVLAMSSISCEALLSNLNDRLCVGNDTNLFVTLFCAFLDVNTGLLTYSNGGHCAPLLVSEGDTTLLPIPKGPLVGVFSGVAYKSMQCTLQPGDALLCYTDGVTEAESITGEQYSESRLTEVIKRSANARLSEWLDRVRQDVADFRASKVLDDDCTMLVVRR